MSPSVTPYLDVQDVLAIARLTLDFPPQARDWGLLHSAVARPRAAFGGADAYPSTLEKAAALLHSVTGNHALIDGNKRTGWAAAMVFLDLNGHRLTEPLDEEAAEELVLAAAQSRLANDEIAVRLKAFVTPVP